MQLLHDCSQVWVSAVEYNIQLLERGYVRWPGFALIRVSCHYVIDVMLLYYVCCLFVSINTCRSVSFHLLLPEFHIYMLLSQLIHKSSKCKGVERQGVSFRPKFVCGMTLPTLYVFDTGTLNGFKGTVNRWLLLLWAVLFFSFPWPRCLWGWEWNLSTILFFPQGPVYNNNNNNNNGYKDYWELVWWDHLHSYTDSSTTMRKNVLSIMMR